MKKKRYLQVFMLVLAVLLTGCEFETIVEEEAVPEKEEAVSVTEISAADDFYGYVNLKKLDTLEIGFDEASAGSFNETDDIIEAQTDEMLKEITESGEKFPKGSNEQVIHDLYQLYLSADKPSDDAEEFFDGLFKKIDEVSDIKDYTDLMAELYRDYNIALFFMSDVRTDPFDPDYYAAAVYPVYYILSGSTLKSIIEERDKGSYQFAQSVLKTLGAGKEEAEQRAKDIMFMFIDIAKASELELYENSLDIYEYVRKCTFDEADRILSSIDLRKYFADCGADIPKEIYIGNEEAVKVMDSLLKEENLQALKDYAKCQLVSDYGNFLPEKYSSLRGRYFPRGYTVKEKEAMMYVKENCGEQISQLYADRYMSDEVIEKAAEMCEDMRASYYELINNVDWLSGEARQLLSRKLENMVFMIGGKKSEKADPGNDMIGKDLLETNINMAVRHVSENLKNINKTYDRYEFGMPANMVNACYDPSNTVTVPYGILHKPFFDPDASEAVNLGAIGSVIAHEMSHAFDSDCIKFDMNGKYAPDWIPEEDIAAFEEKMEKVREYYSDFTIIDVYHVDGELTLGENFADLGGFECVISAVKNDSEKKELMESYANVWCSLTERKYAIELLSDDVHSPDPVRVNAVIASCDDFYRIYGVKEEDGMYIPPEKRVSRW